MHLFCNISRSKWVSKKIEIFKTGFTNCWPFVILFELTAFSKSFQSFFPAYTCVTPPLYLKFLCVCVCVFVCSWRWVCVFVCVYVCSWVWAASRIFLLSLEASWHCTGVCHLSPSIAPPAFWHVRGGGRGGGQVCADLMHHHANLTYSSSETINGFLGCCVKHSTARRWRWRINLCSFWTRSIQINSHQSKLFIRNEKVAFYSWENWKTWQNPGPQGCH